MSDDIKDLLKKNLEVSQRTLLLVEKMHCVALWARFFTFLKWVIIIAFTVWSYLAVQPYIEKFLGMSQQIGNLQNSMSKDGGLENFIKGFLDK